LSYCWDEQKSPSDQSMLAPAACRKAASRVALAAAASVEGEGHDAAAERA
jgi:hypothetical protein